jgi:hypothetical protein
MRLPLVLASLTLITAAASAAAVPQGVPAGALQKRVDLQGLDRIATVELPALNLGAALKEDAERRAQGLPPRFAIPTEWRLSTQDAGTWEMLDADTLLWRLRIRSPGARSLNLGFGRYHMPPGGSLHLYSADRTHVVRPFDAADNESHGELWTPVVLTDDLVLELRLPLRELDQLQLVLTRINQGYRGFGSDQTSLLSGSCNLDVVCPGGIPWDLEIPSVGVISTGGSTFCTGFLVNNVRQDLAPFFMTANHCGISSGSAASLVVYWNYENSTCRTPGGGPSGGAGDGSLAQFNTGSIFRSAGSTSDFTLVELDDPVDPLFDVSYAGWDATGANASTAIAIHHPNTDEKRISFEDEPTAITSYLGTSVPGDASHVRVIDWDVGTTEPGSSGSPLFDGAHRVIGQLHGGFAACGNDDSDWYGRFSVSWTGGGTSSTRLSDWLDPDGTGALVLDTASLATLCSEQGTLDIERGLYACSGNVRVTVVDCDLNLNGSLVEMSSITVFSDSETGGESLLLSETGPDTSRFSGTLPISTIDASGVLLVAAGDTLLAEYVDADDGLGGINVIVQDTAGVDCQAPAILSVSFSNVTATSASMSVTADEPSAAVAQHGFSCAATNLSASSEGLSMTALVELTGLQPDTTYFVKALATDEAGNQTLDTNGGLCHVFTTDDVPNFFTEEFLGDHDLVAVALTFEPSADPDGYSVCRRVSQGFPSDPTGALAVPLSDDGSLEVTLTGGKTVELYGVSYSSFWINANGNLTFGAADGTYSESLTQHFGLPRVAGQFDDFNPSAGGSVLRKQLSNRVAVTWLNVPEFNSSNQNSFQIELFFDGRIQITHLNLASSDGIVGLSAGAGTSPVFIETNLSGIRKCPKIREL